MNCIDRTAQNRNARYIKTVTVDVLPKIVKFSSLGIFLTSTPTVIVQAQAARELVPNPTAEQVTLTAGGTGVDPPFNATLWIIE